MSTDQRIGQFSVNQKLIDRDWKGIALLLSDVLIIRAEAHYASDSIHYTAIGEKFDLRPEGELPPWYRCEVIDGKAVFKRIDE